MAAQKGRGFLLVSGVNQFAMARTTGIQINGEAVDVTTKASGGFRELLPEAGNTSATISVSGVFTDESYEEALITAVLAKTVDAYTLVDELGSEFAFNAQLTSYQNAGEHNGEVTFDATFESSGTITRTPHA